MSKNKGFGRFIGGLALGAGLGILFAPDKGENIRRVLKIKVDDLFNKVKNIDLDEVKDEMLFRIETLQAELETLDKEKVKDIALKQAKKIKEKAEELYKYAIEKGTPVIEDAANEVRKQAVKVVKNIEQKLEETGKKENKIK